MRKRSPILYFALVFGTCYTLFAIPWPGLSAKYSTAYRYVANAAFGTYGDRGRVSFEPAAHANRSADTVVSTKLSKSRYIGDSSHSPRLTGYLPTAEFIALALATPIAWRRRLVGLGIGIVLTHVIIAARIQIALYFWFSTPGTPWQLHELSGWVRRALELLYESVNEAPVASFVFPAILWLVLLFRPADWGGAIPFSVFNEANAITSDSTKTKQSEE